VKTASVMKWIEGIVGGLFVFAFVAFVSAFLLRGMPPGKPLYEAFVHAVIPLFIGLLTGAHSCVTHVRAPRKRRRSFRIDVGGSPKYAPGHCQSCGYDL